MKMMDNCAGTVAARWCKTSIVTIAIDSINFLTSIHNGEIIHTYGRLIYTSKRSIEILVLTFREGRSTYTKKINNNNNNSNNQAHLDRTKNPGIADRFELACTAFFTFVSIAKDPKTNQPRAVQVPQFIPQTSIEKALYNEGKTRYEVRKKAKAQARAKANQNQNQNSNNKNENENTQEQERKDVEIVDENKDNNNNDDISVASIGENVQGKERNDEMEKYKPTVVVGPSGVGKGTLLDILMKRFANVFSKAVSHTTRKARDGEINGKHYFFTSVDEFEKDINNGNFLEYADVHGNYYGTSKASLRNVAKNNHICLLEIDYQGAINIKKLSKDYDGKKYGNNNSNDEYIEANFVFITCPNGLDTLKKRLKGRNTETDERIEKRLDTARKEFEFFENNKEFFDFVLVNDDLNQSAKKLCDQFIEWYPWIKQYDTQK